MLRSRRIAVGGHLRRGAANVLAAAASVLGAQLHGGQAARPAACWCGCHPVELRPPPRWPRWLEAGAAWQGAAAVAADAAQRGVVALNNSNNSAQSKPSKGNIRV